jgi:hypothetical protein
MNEKKTHRSLCLCVRKLRSVVSVQLHTKNPLNTVFVNRHVVRSGSASLKISGRNVHTNQVCTEQEAAYRSGRRERSVLLFSIHNHTLMPYSRLMSTSK